VRPARALAVVLAAVALSAAACNQQSPDSPAAAEPAPQSAAPVSVVGAGAAGVGRAVPAPGWTRPADQAAQVHRAGLDLLAAENLTLHYHAHLDIVLDGRAVPVPAGLRISVTDTAGNIPGSHTPGRPGIAALHTHDTSGVLHVESPTNAQFTLGQLFTEWDVGLGPGHIGSYRDQPGTRVQVYVNGRPFTANPTRLVLQPHQEIAVVISTTAATPAPAPAPSSYAFPAGL